MSGYRPGGVSGGGGGGDLTTTFETVSQNLAAAGAILAYTDEVLTSNTYANGVIKTLAYESGNLASVTLSGAVPGGIALVKTFTYTDGVLTATSYA